MTPYEQAKVENEYFKMLKKDSRQNLLRSPEKQVLSLNECINFETAKIQKRPMGGNWHGYNLDIVTNKLIPYEK